MKIPALTPEQHAQILGGDPHTSIAIVDYIVTRARIELHAVLTERPRNLATYRRVLGVVATTLDWAITLLDRMAEANKPAPWVNPSDSA